MGNWLSPSVLRLVLPVLYAVVIVAVLPLLAGYIVLMERKVMADMQARLGPMRVGPHGLLQPIADAVKLLLKEDIIPDKADRLLFWLAPLVSVTMALLAYAALPIGPAFLIADLNIGLLFILAVSSLGIYGIVLGGWASNSHYSLLGALRSAAQLVSYETAAGLGLISALLLAGSLSMKDIVMAQYDQGIWFIFYVPIGFFIYMVGSIAETNRAPFDLPEAESELVAGYMTEYSGFRWSLYFLAEYANMIIVAGIATTLFLGGWLRPFASSHTALPGTSIELLDALAVTLGPRCRVVLFLSGAEATGENPKARNGNGRRSVSDYRRSFGRRTFCVSRCFARHSRRVLVSGQSFRLHLFLSVVPIYFSTLSLRSIDAARMEIPDSAGACEFDCYRNSAAGHSRMGRQFIRLYDSGGCRHSRGGHVPGEK